MSKKPDRIIVPIGGGQVFKPFSDEHRESETIGIDYEIIRLAKKRAYSTTNFKNMMPRVLFLPTASNDDLYYSHTIYRHFELKIGCKYDHLLLTSDLIRLTANTRETKKQIREKILWADIIYVGGGNTLKMMKLWREMGIDKLLVKAYNQGTILTGLSAGSICWFNHGNSDSRSFSNPKDWKPIKVAGLGLIPAFHCPHYDSGTWRPASVKHMMKTYPGVCIAIEDNCSIIFKNDQYKVFTSSFSDKKAYKIFWLKNKYYKIRIEQTGDFQPLKNLLKKQI